MQKARRAKKRDAGNEWTSWNNTGDDERSSREVAVLKEEWRERERERERERWVGEGEGEGGGEREKRREKADGLCG